MKDKDFLKAINLCYSDSDTKCEKCPFQDIPYCKDFLKSNIANFVNVQEAKIKRLKQDVQTIKNKAYKEFVDRLKKEAYGVSDIEYTMRVDVIDIDIVFKELTEKVVRNNGKIY